MTRRDVKRLRALLEYLDRWQAAHNAWLDWVDREYAARMARYISFRAKAHGKLIEAADALQFKDGRVDNWSRAGDRAKWKFREDATRIFAAVVLEGQSRFGIRGKRDAAGVFIGNVDPDLKKRAAAALRKSFNAG